MASEYDALLEPPQQKSEYDALTEQKPPEKPSGLVASLGKILGKARDIGTEALSEISPEMSQRVFGQTAASLRPEQISPPLISPANAREFVGQLPTWAGGGTPLAQGIEEATAGAVSSFSAPGTFLQAPAFAIPGVAENYAASVIADIPKQAEKLGAIAGEHGFASKEFGAAVTEAGIQDLMGLGAAKGGVAGRFRDVGKKIEATTLSQALAPILGDRRAPEAVSPEAVAPRGPEQTLPLSEGRSAVSQGDYDALVADNQRRLAEGQPVEIPPGSPESALAAPASPEAVPQPEVAGPALVDQKGNVIEQGTLGESHQQLMDRAIASGDETKAAAAIDAFMNDDQHGFVDQEGKPITPQGEEKTHREAAARVGVAAGQLPEGTTKADSQMFKPKEAPKPVEPAVPEPVAPKEEAPVSFNLSSDESSFVHSQAELARASLGPGAASSAEFPLLRAESAKEYAAIAASHLLEGHPDKPSWIKAMREEYGIRDATDTELNKIWKDSHALLADFTEAQTGKALRPKTQIEQATGIRPTLQAAKEAMSNAISRAQGFAEYLRGLAKGSKLGSEAQRKQLGIADKWLSADQEKIRASLTDFVNQTLPVEERGRFIGAIGRALRRPDLLKGDPATMYRNAARVMQAIENRAEEVHKGNVIEDIKKMISRAVEAPGVDVTYRQRIREAVADIGTSKPRPTTIESMKKLNAYIQKLLGAGEQVSADMLERVSGLSKVPLKDMTIPALESLQKKIRLLETLGREKVRSRKIAWLRERADRVRDMRESVSNPLEKNPIFKPQPGERGKMTISQRLGNWFNSGRNWFSGFEKAHAPMDEIYDLLGASKGTYDGWLEQNIRGPLDLAYNSEVAEGTPLREGAQKIIDRHKLTDDDLEKIQVYGISKMEGGEERLAEMGVTDETVEKAQTLTPGQKEFYDYTRGVYDTLLPRIQETAYALDNTEVKAVENYVPLQRDWAAHKESDTSVPGELTFDENATSRQVLNDIGATRLSTKAQQGFTISRVKGAVTAVRLNAADIFNRHLSDALHYIHAQPELRMAGQIARSPAFAEKFGKAGQQIILDHLDTIARQGGVNRFQRLAALDWVRNATSKAQVGFRIASNLVHLSQIPLSVNHAGGPTWWARGMKAALSDEGQAFIKAHAAETTVRSGGEPAQAEVEAISKLGKAGFAVARNIDRLDAQATFLGRYFKEQAAKGITADQALTLPIDAKAQMRALVRTRRAVASPLFKDIPQATSRGLGYGGNVSVARAVNQFRNIFLDNWSNIRHDFFRAGISDAVKNGLSGDNASITASIAAATIMSIALETGIKYSAKQGISKGVGAITGEGDEEDKKHEENVVDDFKHHVINRVPFVGQAVNAAIYGETGVPIIDALVKPLHEIATAVKSKKPETKTKHELRAAGAAATVLGVPGIGQAADIAEKVIVPKTKKKRNNYTITE